MSNDTQIGARLDALNIVLIDLRKNAALFPIAGATLYATGFLIVNSYLASLGVMELEVIRPRYLTVGTLFLALAFGPVVMFEILKFEIFKNAATRGHWYSGPVALAVLTLAVVVTLEVVIANAMSSATSISLVAVAVLAVVGNGLSIGLWAALKSTIRQAGPSIAVIQVPLVFILVLVFYSQLVYPTMFRWLGGGLAEPVELVLTNEGKVACEACGTLKYLVDEDQFRLVLLAELNGRARVVARQHVIAVIHGERR